MTKTTDDLPEPLSDLDGDENEKKLGRILGNPSWVPGKNPFVNDPSLDKELDDLSAVDPTESNQADLAPSGIARLGAFLTSYVKTGRRGNNQKNEFIPGEETKFTKQHDEIKLKATNFFEPADLKELLDKSGENPQKSGHDLLRNVTHKDTSIIQGPGNPTDYKVSPALKDKPADDTTVETYQQFVVKNLIKSNLYHPSKESPFVPHPGAANEEVATKGLFTIQRDLGEFVLKPGTGKDPASGQRVKVSDMSRIALALLAQSAGEKNEASVILDGRSWHLLQDLGHLFHTTEQLGLGRIPVASLRIKSLESNVPDIQNLVAAARGSDSFFDAGAGPKNQSTNNDESYSQLNSFLEPFGSLAGSGGMLVIAIEGVLALLAVSLIISLINGSVGKDSSYVNPKTPYRFAYGSRSKDESTSLVNVIFNLLRITDTDYDFGNCVESGIMLLLGFNPELGLTGFKAALSEPSSLAAFALNLVLSPSYYANLFRQIVRDSTDVIKKFSEIGGSFTSSLTSTVAAIEKLTNSKAYQFIMIAASVGDAAIKSSKGQLSKTSESTLLKDQSIDPAKTWTEPGFLRQHVSRWSGGRNPLSLHTFLASTVSQGETSGRVSKNRSITPSRESVRGIESDLEAEYMPFYFHDLRTHEVISLPAFITQFDEAFNVNYTSTPGYGRQDAVKTYESTERGMTFGFTMVAFNKEDFDEMWFTVNKLIAMCYPQYSKGRQRSFKDGKTAFQFIQPFSQIPAASPVIRLRLGDVLKSNYSQKGLERHFSLDDDTNNARKVYQEAKDREMKKLRDDFEKDKSKWSTFCGKLKYPELSHTLFGFQIPGDSTTISWSSSDVVEVILYNSTIPGKPTAQVLAPNGTYTIELRETDIEFDKSRALDYVETKVAKERLDLNAQVNAGTILSPDQVEDFFKPRNNAIVRSFNSTRGKGMAGVITSLNLNYGEYPYETIPGSKAPKMIDVSLGFSPIHDLPLGLDYEGKLRAPSHPVGSIMKGFGSVYGDEDEIESSRIAENDKDLKSRVTYERLKGVAKSANDKSKG